MNTISTPLNSDSPTGVRWVLKVAEALIFAGHGVTVTTGETELVLATDAPDAIFNLNKSIQATNVGHVL